MNKIANKFSIKYKLVLWSSILLFVLFFCYNLLQYFVINNWTVQEEEKIINQKMDEVQAYFDEISKKSTPLTTHSIMSSENFLEKVNEIYQAIRILDENGNVLMSLSDGALDDQVSPQKVTSEKIFHVRVGSDNILVLRSPINMNQGTGTIEIIRDMKIFNHMLNHIFMVMLFACAGAIVLSGFGGIIISRQLLKPVQVISNTMKKIKLTGMRERVPVYGTKDEITEIGEMFNEIMDRLEESFLQQKQFVEDASHELRTPISIIKGHLNLLNRWGKYDPERLNKSLNYSIQETDKLNSLVLELLELSRAESEKHEDKIERINPVPIIENIINNLKVIHEDFEFIIDFDKDQQNFIQIHARKFEQIMVILLDNAIKYSQQFKWVKCSVQTTANKILIKVSDKGIGIPKNEIPFVLNRFYRVDKARNRKQGGYGLGLSIAKRLTEKYNGAIWIESDVDQGTTVTLQFPV